MKYLILLFFLTSCTSSTEFGQCVGVGDDKDPTKIYKISTWNMVLGIIFFELIVPPVVIAIDETFCPVGKK